MAKKATTKRPPRKTTAKRTPKPTAPPSADVAHIAADLQGLAVPIDDLKPEPRNARLHNSRNMESIADSLGRFGQVSPLTVLEDGTVIAGNGRLAAAKSLGWKYLAVVRFANAADALAYALADNRTAELAEWDVELLEQQLSELQDLDIDVAGIGFDEAEIEAILRGPELSVGQEEAQPTEIVEDDPPEPQADPITQPGDLWILGDHRLLCGDSTNAEDVAQVMDGQRAGLMNTDPPYGVSYANADRPKPRVAKPRVAKDELSDADRPKPRVAKPRVAKDELSDAELQGFLEAAFRPAVATALSENAAWYLWHAHLTQGFFAAAAAAAAANVVLHRQVIWVKPVLLLTRGQYHWKHEPCFMGWVKGNQPPDYGRGNGERDQTTVWEISGVSQAERKEFNHSTPKPVELFAIPIVKHLKPGEIAYEPFSGSGPQIIAAEQLGRRCFAIEISPQYCDVAVKRWEKLTGKTAVRQPAADAKAAA